jgi:hypothetical protein
LTKRSTGLWSETGSGLAKRFTGLWSETGSGLAKRYTGLCFETVTGVFKKFLAIFQYRVNKRESLFSVVIKLCPSVCTLVFQVSRSLKFV